MTFLETGDFLGSVVMYHYSPALELYPMRDTRFNDFTAYLDLHTFIPVFNKNFEKALQSGMPLITMPYTPPHGKGFIGLPP